MDESVVLGGLEAILKLLRKRPIVLEAKTNPKRNSELLEDMDHFLELFAAFDFGDSAEKRGKLEEAVHVESPLTTSSRATALSNQTSSHEPATHGL